MPYPIQYLLDGRGLPVTARPTDRVVDAIAIMMEKEYGQLPVVDTDDCPLGLITYESIIQAISSFTVSVDALLVSHAMVKADIFAVDNDLFDILNRLEDKYAVLIVNQEKRLLGIVTTYDSTAYFRRRAEDLMLIEDIESMLKDMIQAAFKRTMSENSQLLLEQAIARITDSRKELYSRYKQALKQYMGKIDQPSLAAAIDEVAVNETFEKLSPPTKPKQFEHLALSEFIELLLHDHVWLHYEPMIKLERTAVRRILSSVRETRNQLAHFRGEVSAAQRAQLRFCCNWLQQHQSALPVEQSQLTLPVEIPSTVNNEVLITNKAEESLLDDIVIYEDEVSESTSRYAPLAAYLHKQQSLTETITLTFAEIEKLIDGALPTSARSHRSWWANDSQSHIQSQEWLDAGWRVSSVNMSDEVATFTSIKERQKLYIDFFSGLLNDLRNVPNFPIRETASPHGISWFKVARLSHDGATHVASLVFAFDRNGKFRVELYLRSRGQQDKRVFDVLHTQKEEIERQVGETLSWQRLDTKQSSRIALYHPGRITDTPEKLIELKEWAIQAITRLAEATLRKAEDALKATAS